MNISIRKQIVSQFLTFAFHFVYDRIVEIKTNTAVTYRKGLQGTNTLAYCKNSYLTTVKSYKALTPVFFYCYAFYMFILSALMYFMMNPIVVNRV